MKAHKETDDGRGNWSMVSRVSGRATFASFTFRDGQMMQMLIVRISVTSRKGLVVGVLHVEYHNSIPPMY